jgi:hypothetical protein
MNDSGRAVSRILSAPKKSGERTICLSSRYPKPVPRGGTRSGPLLGFLFGLAPDGVFRALPVARQAVSSYLAFSPLPRLAAGRFIFCGTVRRKARASRPRLSSSGAWRCDEVTRHRALWCSDFPPLILTTRSDPPPDRNQAQRNRAGGKWQAVANVCQPYFLAVQNL